MNTNVKLSIASELNKLLNSAKSILEINDYYFDPIRDMFERSGVDIEDYLEK